MCIVAARSRIGVTRFLAGFLSKYLPHLLPLSGLFLMQCGSQKSPGVKRDTTHPCPWLLRPVRSKLPLITAGLGQARIGWARLGDTMVTVTWEG